MRRIEIQRDGLKRERVDGMCVFFYQREDQLKLYMSVWKLRRVLDRRLLSLEGPEEPASSDGPVQVPTMSDAS